MRHHLIPIHSRRIISDPMHFLRREIDRIFDSSSFLEGIKPEFEVKENKDGLHITADLPGIEEKDLNIMLDHDILTISGEKKLEESHEGETYHISERSYGSFSRSLKLPFSPEEKKISASLKEGVLKVMIPRPTEVKPNVHKIHLQK